MQFFFQTDSVTIIRKKGGEYFSEDINTCRVLPVAGYSDASIRKNVIARLRKDPTVVFVLESQDGLCKETAALKGGLSMTVSIDATDRFRGNISISVPTRDPDAFFLENYSPDSDDDSEESDYDAWRDLLARVTSLLEMIEAEDYSFVPDDCPYFECVEHKDPIGIYEATKALKENGYEMESVITSGFVRRPFLFVDENDVVMLGTTHFQGDELFIEMKRMFYGSSPEQVREALGQVLAEQQGVIQVIEWEDGSWSFRAVMDNDLDEDNFMDRLQSDLAQIRAFIGKIESIIGEEPWPIMKEQRQLFIHEVVETSIRLSRLKI